MIFNYKILVRFDSSKMQLPGHFCLELTRGYVLKMKAFVDAWETPLFGTIYTGPGSICSS